MSIDSKVDDASSDVVDMSETQLDLVTGGGTGEPPEPSRPIGTPPPDPIRPVAGEPPDPNKVFKPRTL